MIIDSDKIRKDFPLLNQRVYNKPLIYLDNAATTQKPLQVIETITKYYSEENSNVHRGVHFLSQQATLAFENARVMVQKFINATFSHEIIFTKGTTESINLVANSFGRAFLKEGDEILISTMEHHSNIVPWQLACSYYNANLKVIPIFENGELDFDSFKVLLSDKTKLIAITHVSNTLGTINPVKKIIEIAHQKNIPVLIDGAQGIAHTKVDVQNLDCDFYCFSGHKIYGPMGVGVLYGKEKWLNQLPPYQGGGEMIKKVTFENTTFNELPFKFEAGTPSVADVIGLSSALDYVSSLGINKIEEYENELLKYATSELSKIDEIKIIGRAEEKAALISFLLADSHPFDVGTIINHMGIAVRTGHHCTQPLMDFYNIPGTIRASFSFYNTFEEINLFVDAIKKTKQMLI